MRQMDNDIQIHRQTSTASERKEETMKLTKQNTKQNTKQTTTQGNDHNTRCTNNTNYEIHNKQQKITLPTTGLTKQNTIKENHTRQ